MKTTPIQDLPSWLARVRGLVVLVAALMLGTPAGAWGQDTSGSDGLGQVVTTLTRLDAVPGSTVLLPVVPAGAPLDALLGPPAGWIPGSEPSVTIAGRPLASGLYRLDGGQRDARHAESWLPVAMEWTSTPLARARPADAGAEVSFWVLMVTLPDRPIARTIEIGGKRLSVHWLDPPPATTDVARLPLLEASLDARRALGDFLRSEARDPFRRWRCALVADRFSAHALWGEKPALGAFSDPVLEAGAANAEVRARAAIDAAARIDPDLAGRLLSALTAVVKMPTGELLPAWPADDAETLELLSGLLDPGRSGAKKRADLEVWLSRVPGTLAWVVSDDAPRRGAGRGEAGQPGASRAVLVGIANLTDRQVICSCAPEGRPATNAETLLAHRVTFLRTGLEGAAGMRTKVVARTGTMGYPLTVVSGVPAAAPPGIDLGPLRPDWSMATWLGSRPPTPDLASAATARLYAETLDADPETRRWRVAIEARTPDAAPSDGTDVIRIWCARADGRGDLHGADAIISVDASGKAWIDTGDGTSSLKAERTSTDRGWTANVELPSWLTKGEPIVSFGVERVDGRGVRSAWPRPMMPGQEAPGMLGVDLGAWLRLGR